MVKDRAIVDSEARRIQRQCDCCHPLVQSTNRCRLCGKLNTVEIVWSDLPEKIQKSLLSYIRTIA